MDEGGALILILVLLMASVAFAVAIGRAAEQKGRNYGSWVVIGFFFTIPAAIIVACMTDQGGRRRGGTVYRCPDCAEEVQAAAVVCKHCGARFKALTPPA